MKISLFTFFEDQRPRAFTRREEAVAGGVTTLSQIEAGLWFQRIGVFVDEAAVFVLIIGRMWMVKFAH